MKISLSSYTAMGAWWVLRLMAEGHKVSYYLSDSKYEDVLKGLIPAPKILDLDHRRSTPGFPSYKSFDYSLFDLTGRAEWAESSRRETPTLGDGGFEHELEDNREFGIICMEQCGINVPPYTRFNTPSEAKAFIKKTDKRYVYKPFTIGGTTQDTATTYVAKDGKDLFEYIDSLWQASKRAPFILQEFISGTEIGTEAFFNGEDFYLVTGTLEEKKFMNDNKGPNTGCSGNLIFGMNQDEKIFKEGLLKAKPMLQSVGFRGILDLNTIVTQDKVYGLEWTPRFGYLCCPTIATMYGDGYGELLHDIASGKAPSIKWTYRFGAATTLTIPPYPTELRMPKYSDIPIGGLDPENIDQLRDFYLFDAKVKGKQLVTTGNYGYIGAQLAGGDTIEGTFNKLKGLIKGIDIPNCQYRTDIYSSTLKRYMQLKDWNWI